MQLMNPGKGANINIVNNMIHIICEVYRRERLEKN